MTKPCDSARRHVERPLLAPSTTRRQILAGAASVAMTGWASAAQRPYRLAYLVPASPAANELNRRALFGALAELGYREGHNLVVERRFAEGRFDRLSALAAELVALKPDVLFAGGSQATLAASKATTTVPIVFVAVSDPVGMQIVKSLQRKRSPRPLVWRCCTTRQTYPWYRRFPL